MGACVNEHRLKSCFEALSSELSTSLSVHTFARDRLVQRMRKRAGFVNSQLDPIAKAKFVELNNGLKGFRHSLDSDVVSNARHFITTVIERQNTRFNELNIQVSLDLTYVLSNWRFGPGSANGVVGSHAARKIGESMTCTLECEPYILRLRRSNYYFSTIDRRDNCGTTVIYGSRMTTVPKNEDTVRTIAIEPSGNMAMQLAAGRVLEDTLRSIGLDISDQQPKNKLLAQRGSIDGTVCTIDLKSASDMISLDLVRSLMPDDWVSLLNKIRSPVIDIDGNKHELNMVSTMGNGFTFPLMTLIIVSLIYALRCRKANSPTLWVDWTDTAVFGDDIIVPTDEYSDLCILLEQSGLIVNHDKSFAVGDFRESCGGDFWKGVDVTPFYIRNLRTDPEIYVAMNSLLEWSARHDFWPNQTLKLLRSYLRGPLLLVPEWLNPDQGLKTVMVPKSYKRYELVAKETIYDGFFLLPLACAGYLTGRATHAVFCERESRPFYKVRSARLPRGYLDGRDPLSRSHRVSERIWFLTIFLN